MLSAKIADINPSSACARALYRSCFLVPFRSHPSKMAEIQVRVVATGDQPWRKSYYDKFEMAADHLGGTVNKIKLREGAKIDCVAVNARGEAEGLVSIQLPPNDGVNKDVIKRIDTHRRNDYYNRTIDYEPVRALKGIGSVLVASAAQLLLRFCSTISPAYPLDVISSRYARSFYEHLGMEQDPANDCRYFFQGMAIFDFLRRMYIKYPEPAPQTLKPNP